MSEVPLTKEQRDFATKWHNLIYAFLNDKNLSERDYYDIVVFGYLRAVKRYFTEPELQKYSFSTIAWKAMECDLCNHRKMLARQKRNAYIISIHACDEYGDAHTLEEVLPAPDKVMAQLETELLLHDLAAMASHQQMSVVRMRSEGYNMREIAKKESIPMKRVHELLDEIRVLIDEVCYG